MNLASARTYRSGRLAILELNHPPVNALDAELVTSLKDSVQRVAMDPRCRALLVRGAGGCFAAGADIRAAQDMSTEQFRTYIEEIHDTFDKLEALSIPTVAAIEGFAVGGGLELAMCCDVRVMAESARVGLPELRLGLMPAAGGLQRLLPRLGKGRLLEIVYSARLLNAREAHDLGIVEIVVPDPDFSHQAEKLALALSTGPSSAQAAVKKCVLTARNEGYLPGRRVEIDNVVAVFGTSDAKEGMDAFLGKREPAFVGSGDRADKYNSTEQFPAGEP